MPSFRLEYENDGNVQEFSFDGASVSIGRDKSSDFVLDHPTVSRQHALIVHKNGGYRLVVVSRGGLTAIDGQKAQGEVPLYDGSMLHLGKLNFRFRSLDAPQKPATNTGQHNAVGGLGGGQPSGFNSGQDGSPSPMGQQQGGQSGFGQQPSQGGAQSGFGPQTGGFAAEQSSSPDLGAGGFGMGDSPASGPAAGTSEFGAGAGAQGAQDAPSGGQQADSGQSVQGPSQPNDSGIISWDEIASSSEAMEDDQEPKAESVYERMQGGSKKQKTNPLVVGVAGAAIVGLLWFTFFSGGGGKGGPAEKRVPVEDQEPVKIKVVCMGESACVQRAGEAYRVGLEKLERKDAAVANLFDGYKKLLEAEAFLAKAGRDDIPKEMRKLEPKRDQAREELTSIFRNYRVKYHRASKRSQYREMAQSLDAIKSYFPDKTAREHNWARQEKLDMKKQGIYPKHVYPQR